MFPDPWVPLTPRQRTEVLQSRAWYPTMKPPLTLGSGDRWRVWVAVLLSRSSQSSQHHPSIRSMVYIQAFLKASLDVFGLSLLPVNQRGPDWTGQYCGARRPPWEAGCPPPQGLLSASEAWIAAGSGHTECLDLPPLWSNSHQRTPNGWCLSVTHRGGRPKVRPGHRCLILRILRSQTRNWSVYSQSQTRTERC